MFASRPLAIHSTRRGPARPGRGAPLDRAMAAVGLSFELLAGALLAAFPTAVLAEDPPDFLLQWGSQGSGDGEFQQPQSVVWHAGEVFTVDSGTLRVQRFTPAGDFLGAWSHAGTNPGEYQFPNALALAPDGTLYVLDLHAKVLHYTAAGSFLGEWGSYGSADGEFQSPWGIAVGPDGYVYVADKFNHRIQKFTAAGVFDRKWGVPGTGPGEFNLPHDLVVDGTHVYVTDQLNRRVQKFTDLGAYVTQWGSQGTGDGQFGNPFGITVDPDGNVYVADGPNSRVQKFDASGTFLTKWGTPGSLEGQFSQPWDVATDLSGHVYVDDKNNFRIQKFGPPDPVVPGTLSGKVFHDADADCAQGGGEGDLAGRRVLLEPAGRVRTTAADGSYTFLFVLPGNYTLSLLPRNYWEQTCPPASAPRAGTLNSGEAVGGLDFGSRVSQFVEDLSVTLGGGQAISGYGTQYASTYSYAGALPVNATVVMHLPVEVLYQDSAPPGVYDGGAHTVTWTNAMDPGEAGWAHANVLVPVTVPLGTLLTTTIEILPVAGDANPADNTAAVTNEVVASEDPNAKSVAPPGAVGHGQRLRYHVDFQNVGSAPAVNIVMRDTLDANLDIATLVFGASSHPNAAVVNDRELSWTFNGIMLPDSTSDEPHSHGFVEFDVALREGLAIGTEIENGAAIYFDFNPAVLTNVVVNTVVATNVGGWSAPGSGAGVSPRGRLELLAVRGNPGRGGFALELRAAEGGRFTADICDVRGRVVRLLREATVPAGVQLVEWDGRADDGRAAPPGVYFAALRLRGGAGESALAARLVVLR